MIAGDDGRDDETSVDPPATIPTNSAPMTPAPLLGVNMPMLTATKNGRA
jgi:hypothetical protein